MRHLTTLARFVLGTLLATGAPAAAAAQPVPQAGQVAAGVDLGLFLPADAQFESSITGGGFFEFFLTSRAGLRAGAMAMRPAYVRGSGEQERQIRIAVDLVHNWEHGRVHPFAGAGVGLHLLRLWDEGVAVGERAAKLGVSALGGAEFFLSREWTLKAEGRYQWVGDRPLVNPDGFALTVGIKRYF